MPDSSIEGGSPFEWEEFLRNPSKGWEGFWESYGSCVRNAISRFQLTRQDAEDILQETVFRLIKDDFVALKKWDKERSSLSTYLSVVAVSVSLDFLKSSFHQYEQKKIKPKGESDTEVDLLDTMADSGLRPDEHLQQRQVIERIVSCLNDWAGLKQEDKILIYMRLIDVPFGKISNVLGLRENALMTRFSRLKEEFRKRLKDRGIDLSEL